MVSSAAHLVTRIFTIQVLADLATVWAALRSPGFTSEWWFANTVEAVWLTGEPIGVVGEDGSPELVGEVLAVAPPEHLAVAFRPAPGNGSRVEAGTRIDWRLAVADDAPDAAATTVTLAHSGVVAGSLLDHETTAGWGYLLESLKALVER